MSWPTWDQAVVAAVVSALVAVAARRWRDAKVGSAVGSAARELTLIASLYALWQAAHLLPLAHDQGAIARARQIVTIEHDLHLPTELSLQRLVLAHDWLGRATSLYYGVMHVPALIGFIVWLFVRQRAHYPRWRNGLVAVTGGSLLIRFVRVAPPRFLTDLGYIDLSERFGPSIYGPVGTGVSDQFAAMPSIHVGWAAVVGLGALVASRSRWRWLVVLHLPLTILVVSASGHHWWLDGAVAIGLLGIGLVADSQVRRLATAMSARRTAPTVGTSPPVDDPQPALA